MRILIISLVYPPEHAPAGIMVAELASELAHAGHDVTVLTGFPSHPAGRLFPEWKAKLLSREQTEGSFTLLRCLHSFAPRFGALGKMWYHFTFAVSSFWAGLRAGRFDVLVLQSTPAFCGPAAILLAWVKKAKTFYWIHDIHPESAINAGLLKEGVLATVMKATDSWVCRRANLVATMTEDMREVLLARGLPAEHVIIQRHWLDEDRIQPSSGPNGWRDKHGISPTDFVALHAGTIGYVSGALVIVEAARVLAQHPGIVFLFVGDGPLKAELQEKAKEYGLTNVRFLPFQSEEDLGSMLASADVGLVTLNPESAATSIPSKMHGYTSAARPLIASVAPRSAVAHFISAGGFGWAVPPADPEALAGAVLQAAADTDECRRRGQKARAFFVSEFGRRVVVNGFRQKLEGLHPQPPEPRSCPVDALIRRREDTVRL
jgi:colanic acid biosynthesis glycosyl transferase WcaI